MPASTNSRLRGARALVRAGRATRRLLAPVALGWAAFAALALADRLPPGAARVGALALLAAASLAAIALAAGRTPPVGRRAASRWLEHGGGLRAGALTPSRDDDAFDDPLAARLWARARLPAPTLARAARGWVAARRARVAAAAGLAVAAVALAAAGAAWPERLARGFSPYATDLGGARLAITAYPPSHARGDPVRMTLRAGDTRVVRALPGARIEVAVDGPAGPWTLEDDGGAVAMAGGRASIIARRAGAWTVAFGARRVARFELALARDAPPVIAWRAAPADTGAGALRLAFAARDDLGDMAIGVEIAGAGPARRRWLDGRESGAGVRHLALAQDAAAGRTVMLRLLARDGGGQIGRSEPVAARLPRRAFAHPVAREIVAARAALLDAPGERGAVARELDAIAARPERFGEALGVFAALRAARHRLEGAGTEAGGGAARLLWDAAVALDGDGAEASALELARALNALEAAMAGADGAAARAAMRRLEAAAGELARAAPAAPPARGALDAAVLAALARELADRVAAGDRDGARALLATLRQAIEEARLGAPGAGGEARRAAAARALAARQRGLTGRSAVEGGALAGEQAALGREAAAEGFGAAAAAMARAGAALKAGGGGAGEAARAQREAAAALDAAASAAEAAGAGARDRLDPLGRPGAGFGVGRVEFADPARARNLEAIRRLLRERSADPRYPAAERAYFLRLLRRF